MATILNSVNKTIEEKWVQILKVNPKKKQKHKDIQQDPNINNPKPSCSYSKQSINIVRKILTQIISIQKQKNSLLKKKYTNHHRQ